MRWEPKKKYLRREDYFQLFRSIEENSVELPNILGLCQVLVILRQIGANLIHSFLRYRCMVNQCVLTEV